jgi:hypothetical protein
MALEYATIVADCLPSLSGQTSLYRRSTAGNRPVRACSAARRAAHARAGGSCCARVRATRDCSSSESVPAGRARSSSRSQFYRGDTYDFVAELSTP